MLQEFGFRSGSVSGPDSGRNGTGFDRIEPITDSSTTPSKSLRVILSSVVLAAFVGMLVTSFSSELDSVSYRNIGFRSSPVSRTALSGKPNISSKRNPQLAPILRNGDKHASKTGSTLLLIHLGLI